MPKVPDVYNLYELNFDSFHLPEGVIPLDIIHRIDYKISKNLTIPILNTNSTICSLNKNSPIGTLILAGKCKQEIRWTTLQDNTTAKPTSKNTT